RPEYQRARHSVRGEQGAEAGARQRDGGHADGWGCTDGPGKGQRLEKVSTDDADERRWLTETPCVCVNPCHLWMDLFVSALRALPLTLPLPQGERRFKLKPSSRAGSRAAGALCQ